MPPPPTPTQQPLNHTYFNTILNPSHQQQAPPSNFSPSPSTSANNIPTSSTTQTPTRARTPGSTSKPHTSLLLSSAALAASREKEKRMRSAQARGKGYHDEIAETNPRARGRGTRAMADAGANVGNAPRSPEGFESRSRREWAAAVLSSLELVVWYAGVRNESIPQTRTYFQNIFLGIPPHTTPAVVWREEWEVPESQRVRTTVDKDRDRSGDAERERDEGDGDGADEDIIMGGMGGATWSPAWRDKGKGKKKVDD